MNKMEIFGINVQIDLMPFKFYLFFTPTLLMFSSKTKKKEK